MQEDLVIKLSEFGFTTNQAKVYLSIIQSGSITAAEISKVTQLHPQDVYKILPKLEKMGLITKTIDKPALVQAISVEEALEFLVAKENDKIRKRISHLKLNMKELGSVAIQRPFSGKLHEEKNLFIALTTDDQIKNMSKVTFEKISKEYELMMNLELMTSIIQKLRNHIRQIGNRAKIRLIVENQNPNQEKIVIDTIEKIRPRTGDFSAKIIPKMESIGYYLIDNSELWISMRNKTESGSPCVLWTNDAKMVEFFHENFHQAWNDSSALMISSKNQNIEFAAVNKEVAIA